MRDIFLVLDVGNTNVVMGLYHDRQLISKRRIPTDRGQNLAWYLQELVSFCTSIELPLDQLKAVALSSVVPQLTNILSEIFLKHHSLPFINVNAYTELGMTFAVKDPGFIGADLIVNAYAAREKYRANCIICDLGTASTVQLIGVDGFFHGTVIAPGLNTAAENLYRKAAQLKPVDLDQEPPLLGTSTAASLLAGLLRGHSFFLDGYIEAIRQEYHHLGEIKVVATGGLSPVIHRFCRYIDVIEPDLTLNGLNLICLSLL